VNDPQHHMQMNIMLVCLCLSNDGAVAVHSGACSDRTGCIRTHRRLCCSYRSAEHSPKQCLSVQMYYSSDYCMYEVLLPKNCFMWGSSVGYLQTACLSVRVYVSIDCSMYDVGAAKILQHLGQQY